MQGPANILQPAAQTCNRQHSADGTSSAHQPLSGRPNSAAAVATQLPPIQPVSTPPHDYSAHAASVLTQNSDTFAAASLNRSTARTAVAAVLMVSSLGAAAGGVKSHDVNQQKPGGEAPACQAAVSGPDEKEKPAGAASAEPLAPPPLPPSFLVARAALTMAAALAAANVANGHQKSG